MKSFKEFLQENALHDAEDFLHHIAEEELISCKVFELKQLPNGDVAFVADCNDKPRSPGFQADLTTKLKKRLAKQNVKGLGIVSPRVYHKNIPENDLLAGIPEVNED